MIKLNRRKQNNVSDISFKIKRKKAWNYGLTKETDERVAKNASQREGQCRSEETKQKMRKPKSEEHKKKLSEARRKYSSNTKGKHWVVSEEGRQNMSQGQIKGYLNNPDKINKILESRKWYKPTEETKIKMRKPHKPHSEEAKKKISITHKGLLSGDKHPNWQGGISFEIYPQDWTNILREAIRQRDNYSCQLCGIEQKDLEGRFQRLHVHHIDYDKENCDPRNLISLCSACHSKTNHSRNNWEGFFNNKTELKNFVELQ